MRNCGEKSWKRMIVLGAAILAFCSSLSLAADSITGVVHNQTDGRSAAGDEVILLAVGQTHRRKHAPRPAPRGYSPGIAPSREAAPGSRDSSRRQLRSAGFTG